MFSQQSVELQPAYIYYYIFSIESRFYFESNIKCKVSQRVSIQMELVEITSILKYQIYIINVISAKNTTLYSI